MKIAIAIFLLSICCASAVLGVIDPCPNDMGVPLSAMRQDCLMGVSTDPIAWDAIKSMYR